MYLKDKITGTKYFMTSSTIGESPEKATTLDLGETVFFKMYFPRLNNVTDIEIGEGMNGGNWSFNNIQIPNKQQFTVEAIEKFSIEKHEELFSHLHNEYYEEALKELKKITKKGKIDFRARVAAAVIDYSLNNIDSAIANLTHIARQPEGKRAYTMLSGFRSFCLCTTDFILVKGRCLMPRVSNNCFNFCSGREHFFTDISCSALL